MELSLGSGLTGQVENEPQDEGSKTKTKTFPFKNPLGKERKKRDLKME
jgi:hypothetical protein